MVCARMAEDVSPVEAMPVHESPFEPVTVHESAFEELHEIFDVSPTWRRLGVAFNVAESTGEA